MSGEQPVELTENEIMLARQNAYLAQYKKRGVEFMLAATMIYQRAWQTALDTKREFAQPDEYACRVCGTGNYLPSGKCDHCNTDFLYAEAAERYKASKSSYDEGAMDALDKAMQSCPKRESGWVIELLASSPAEPQYWAGSSLWASEHAKAIRFARKQDAQQAADLMLDGMNIRICEHIWE